MKKLYKLSLAIVLLSQSACNDLDTKVFSFDQPEDFFTSEKSAQLALNGAYDVLQGGYITGYYELNEVPSEFLTNANVNTDREELDILEVTANNLFVNRFWASAYDAINRTNLVIDRVQGITFKNEANKQRIIAEARFLRGLHYFNLVRFFGGVPLRLSETTSLKNIRQARDPLEAVYNQAILPDLQFAVGNLPIRSVSKLGRATKGAAQTVLAKVYMTLGQWSEAQKQIDAIVTSNEYSLLPNYESLWNGRTQNSKEIVFSIQYSTAPGENSNYLTSNFAPSGSGLTFRDNGRNMVAEMPFFEGFPKGPRKNPTFLTEFTVNGKTTNYTQFDQGRVPYPSTNKFFDLSVSANESVDFPMLRYADVLLMQAETLNEVNKSPTANAYQAINTVRERAGLEDLPAGLTYQQFSDAVFEERRWELAYEGHGLLDLYRTKRLNYLEKTAAASKQTPNNIKITPTKYLLPIPFTEVLASDGLIEQNPGY